MTTILTVSFAVALFLIWLVFQKQTKKKDNEILDLSKNLAAKEQNVLDLNQKITEQDKSFKENKELLKTEFENIANRILQDKSSTFVKTNETAVSAILTPLKEDIKNFKHRVETIYNDGTKQNTELKSEIKNLLNFSNKVSEEANNLADALRGESKTQGNWGEAQLEMLLERSGLQKDIHYQVQQHFSGDNGKKLIPDFIINLPGSKNIIADSKVSLTAYEKYFNETDKDKKAQHLKQHLDSIKTHISDLSSKNYQNIYQINSPDFVLMFFPLESALALAMREDIAICEKALSKNVALVSGSTMLTVLNTVRHIWTQENQKKNAQQIAYEGGALYDKFVAFTEDLNKVGTSIENAKTAHYNALNKLHTSSKKGDTIIGRVERLKALGAKTSKSLPQNVLDNAKVETPALETEKKEGK